MNVILLLKSFVFSILNYKPQIPASYRFSDFNARCNDSVLFPNISDFSKINSFELNCNAKRFFEEKSLENTNGDFNWTIIENGFHSTMIMEFPESYRTCIGVYYIPETSYLDLPDTNDRELPAPQPPSLHFIPLNRTKIDVLHRYQLIDEFEIPILRFPKILCRSNGEFHYIDIKRPDPVSIIYDAYCKRSHQELTYYITFLIPILAFVINLLIMVRSFINNKKKHND